MIKTLGLILIGYGLSWISMIIAIENKKYRNEEDKRLIDELTRENKEYKKVIERWRAKYDAD